MSAAPTVTDEMDRIVRAFFERYAAAFNQGLRDDVDPDAHAALYASEFIVATPAGVTTGRNGDDFKAAMAQGFARYRAIGTQSATIEQLDILAIDDRHCLARVGWRTTYERPGGQRTTIAFDIGYFLQVLDEPKVFGWVSGDERAVLEAHGIG